jgi:uncharacterized protein YbgA (DUF1722 family)
MRLEGDPAAPRLVTSRTGIDLTERMSEYCQRTVKDLENQDLCGFIFKKNSPSSGLFRVKVYGGEMPVKTGRGLFAEAFVRHFPLLPVEEEGRLYDMNIRENFIERVFALREWKDFLLEKRGMGALVEFHARRKLQLMAHSPEIYREMGRLVVEGKSLAWAELLDRYQNLLMRALSLHATVKKNSNVLSHIMGYFKQQLTPEEKVELLEVNNSYQRGLVPLIVPVTLLKHYVRKYDQEYLQKQTYLSPHPMELMLRNHV